MVDWLKRALFVALATAVMTPVAIALEMVVFALAEGGDIEAGLAALVESLTTIMAAAFVAAFLLVLIVLWPASLMLRRTSLEQPYLYLTIGAAVGVALGFAGGSGETAMDEMSAIWFFTWGGIAGVLFWTAFRRSAPGPAPAAAPANG